MPFIGQDEWEEQYFKNVTIPKNVVIPVDDVEAYQYYPRYNWIYNKLKICETQNIFCAPTPIASPSYPIFVKPIVNLWGMGAGGHVVHSLKELEETFQPGQLWMPYFTGTHYSTDCVVIEGELHWVCHAEGVPFTNLAGTFDYWHIKSNDILEICILIIDWIRDNLPDYTGMLNIETIGNNIIEAHLRLSPQFIDLYPRGFLEAVVQLHDKKVWYLDREREEGYSLVLFATNAIGNFKLLDQPKEILSIQDCSKDIVVASEPPGGVRLAVFNCRDFDAGLKYRRSIILINKLLSLIE